MKNLRSAVAVSAIVLAAAGSAAAQATGSGEMMGQHSMEGQVTSVDAKKGWVHLKTPEGTMIVHFPPAALQNVKKGDTVTVSLALKDNGPGAKAKK
jgi:hypothetical protein